MRKKVLTDQQVCDMTKEFKITEVNMKIIIKKVLKNNFENKIINHIKSIKYNDKLIKISNDIERIDLIENQILELKQKGKKIEPQNFMFGLVTNIFSLILFKIFKNNRREIDQKSIQILKRNCNKIRWIRNYFQHPGYCLEIKWTNMIKKLRIQHLKEFQDYDLTLNLIKNINGKLKYIIKVLTK